MGLTCSVDRGAKSKKQQQQDRYVANPQQSDKAPDDNVNAVAISVDAKTGKASRAAQPAAPASSGGGAAPAAAVVGKKLYDHSTFHSFPLVFGDVDCTALTAFGFGTNSPSLFAGSESGDVARIDPFSGVVMERFPKHHTRDVNKLVCNDSTRTVYSCSRDKLVRGIRVSQEDNAPGYTSVTFEGHTLNVTCIAVSPDGQRVFSGSRDNCVRLWNAETQQCYDVRNEKLNIVHCCVWLDGLGVVAQGGEDLTIRLWDIRADNRTKMSLHHTLANFDYHPICCEEVPDGVGHTIVTGHNGFNGKGSMITAWDLRTMKPLCDMLGHEGTVRWLCAPRVPTPSFSAKKEGTAQQLFSASDDGTVREWNIGNRECLGSYHIEDGRVTALVDLGEWKTDDGSPMSALAVSCREGAVMVAGIDAKGSMQRLRTFGSGSQGKSVEPPAGFEGFDMTFE